MSKEKINIHFYPSPITNESRMLKITQSLAKRDYFDKIFLIGVLEEGLQENEKIDDKREIVRIKRITAKDGFGFIGKALKTIEWSFRVLFFVKSKNIVCINCHSLPVLPLCVLIAWLKNSKLIYDTHELETETITMHGLKQKLFKTVEKLLIKHVDSTIAVDEQISKWYSAEYNIQLPTVVRNIPCQKQINNVKSNILRNYFQIKSDDLVFITSGLLDIGRGIERLLNIFSKCSEKKHLVFMGYGHFETLIKELSSKKKNIHFLPAVKPELVHEYVSGADVGFCLIESLCLSYHLSLPNKLFEYIMAGLPVCINDLPEQKKIIEDNSCGWIAPKGVDAMVDFINGLTREQIVLIKKNVSVARNNFGWHNEEKMMLKMYERLFK